MNPVSLISWETGWTVWVHDYNLICWLLSRLINHCKLVDSGKCHTSTTTKRLRYIHFVLTLITSLPEGLPVHGTCGGASSSDLWPRLRCSNPDLQQEVQHWCLVQDHTAEEQTQRYHYCCTTVTTAVLQSLLLYCGHYCCAAVTVLQSLLLYCS